MRLLLPALLALLAATAVAAQTAPRPDPDTTAADSVAIRALLERTAAANNAGDVDGWVALFADDAVYMAPGTPTVRAREGLREIARAGFRHRADIAIEPEEIQVQRPLAYAVSRVTGTVTLAGSGEVVEVDSRQVTLYRRDEAGEWRIARMMMNRPR